MVEVLAVPVLAGAVEDPNEKAGLGALLPNKPPAAGCAGCVVDWPNSDVAPVVLGCVVLGAVLPNSEVPAGLAPKRPPPVPAVLFCAPKPVVAGGCVVVLDWPKLKPVPVEPAGLAPNRPPPVPAVLFDAPKAGVLVVPVFEPRLPNENAGLFCCVDAAALVDPKEPNVDGCVVVELPNRPPGLACVVALFAPNEKPPPVAPVDGAPKPVVAGCCVVDEPNEKPVDGCDGCVVEEPKPPKSGLGWVFWG